MKVELDLKDLPSSDEVFAKWSSRGYVDRSALREEALRDLAVMIKGVPFLHHIVIRADIPSFNDGDPCSFGIYEIFLNGFNVDSGDFFEDIPCRDSWSATDFDESMCIQVREGSTWGAKDFTPSLCRVEKAIYNMSDLLEAAFCNRLELEIWEEANGDIFYTIEDWGCDY